MDTSRKKFFWPKAQPLLHRLLHLFVGPERLASHRLFERSKDMKVTRCRGLASKADVEDTRRTDLRLFKQLNGQYGAEYCHVGAKHLYSTSFGLDCRRQVILYEICTRYTGQSVPPGHVVLQNYPSFIAKESV